MMSEHPVPASPIEPLEIQWPAIVRQIFPGNSQIDATPFKKSVSDGYFAAVLLRWPEQWQRQALIVFPYEDEAWQMRARTVLEFERTCWERWCALQEILASRGTAFCAPVWWSDGASAAAVGDVNVSTERGEVRVPYLLRPYVPLPSLAERTVADSLLADLADQLRPDAEWVCGTESVESYLQRRDAPPATPARHWWSRLGARLRSVAAALHARFVSNRSSFRWVAPPPSAVSTTGDAPRPEHFLSDGHLLVPTRWRTFHRDYANFGQLPNQYR